MAAAIEGNSSDLGPRDGLGNGPRPGNVLGSRSSHRAAPRNAGRPVPSEKFVTRYTLHVTRIIITRASRAS